MWLRPLYGLAVVQNMLGALRSTISPHSKLQANMSEHVVVDVIVIIHHCHHCYQTSSIVDIIVIGHHCYHCYHTSFLSVIAKISRRFLTQHCQSFKCRRVPDVASASHWRFALGFHLLIGASHYGESRLSSKTNMRCMVFTAVASVLGRYEAY